MGSLVTDGPNERFFTSAFPLDLFGQAFAAITLTAVFEGRARVRRSVGPVVNDVQVCGGICS
jgi:hypothetical protein